MRNRGKIQWSAFFQKRWSVIALVLISVLSFGLNFYAISKLGYGNGYYAAAIKSMTQSFKNFFFVSFDPAGFVSVDKPPLGLWIQAIFVLIFGYNGWAMLLPQALAGTGSSIMMYFLTKKYFGKPAGLIAALVFALTPAVVVASRNNTIDTQLIFVLLVATWFLFKSIEQSRWRYLFLCGLFIGIGFNIKMLQAYMIIPAVVIVYLVFAKEKFAKRIVAGLISLVIMVAVSCAWVVIVDLYPASGRPYVDSSTNNTELQLIFGHNGVERLSGQGSGGTGMGKGEFSGGGQPQMGGQNNTNGGPSNNTNGEMGTPPSMPNQSGNTNGSDGNVGNPPSMPNQSGNTNGSGENMGNPPSMPNQSGNTDGSGENMGNPSASQGKTGNQKGGQTGDGAGGISGNEIGTAGFFRLWTQSMYGQASWLIILAVFCIIAKIRKFDIKKLNLKQGVFVFWIIWFISMFGFFSFAGFYHRYYLCMMAPGIAGIVGPGMIEMINAFKNKRSLKQILLPLSLIATFAAEIIYVISYSALKTWLAPVMIAFAAAALISMAVYYFRPKRLALVAAVSCMLISLLAAPLYWSLTVVMYVPENITMPYAGPELASSAKTPGMTANQGTLTTVDDTTKSLEKYLVNHYKKGSYLVVSQNANSVAQFIVDTGLPAVAYGGFLGSDNSMTLTKFKELVKEGKITYFLVTDQNGGNSNSEIISYVKKNATLISSSEYNGTSSNNGQSSGTLYLFK